MVNRRTFPALLAAGLCLGMAARPARAEEIKKIRVPYKTLVSLDKDKDVRGQIIILKADGTAVGSLDKKGDAFDLPEAGTYTLKIYPFGKDTFEFHTDLMVRNGGSYSVDLVGATPSWKPWAGRKVKATLVKQTSSAPAMLVKNTDNDTDLMLEIPAR